MIFFEDFIVYFAREVLFGSFKYIGIVTKLLFHLGKKPISEIMNEDWNTRIGFIVCITLILFVYLVN